MGKNLRADFNGTWRFANEKEPDGWNYLHFSGGNRIVQFFNITEGNFESGKMLVAEVDDQIEFFPEDGKPGWTRNFRFDDGNLVIIEGDDEYPCSRLEKSLPWLEGGIAEADVYFDEKEANWGKSG